MNFTNFNFDPSIAKALTTCGYTSPTPIQAQAIPEVIAGKDILASAPTGSGKTAAFVLPTLQLLTKQQPTKKTRVLILTPTRELASQITKAANLYGKFLRFNIISLVGGMSYHHQIKDLQRGADIIVATPGRLLDHIEQKRVDLSNVEMLVLDEADRMLDMGFIDDVQYIAKLTPAKRQTLLFSATIDNKLSSIVKQLLKNPVRIDLSNEKVTSPQIKQEMYKANNLHHKSRLLRHFLNDANVYKAIIFSATKINADNLAIQLRNDGFAAAALHGDLKQNVRNRTIDQLRHGKIQFLVATDVAARGIDISDVTHVINFDLPRFCEDYVHRIGRTGRAGKTGTAISFVLPADTRHLQKIERYIGQRLKLVTNFMPEEGRSGGDQAMQKQPANDRFSEEHSSRPARKEGGYKFKERSPRFETDADKYARTDRKRRFDKSERPARNDQSLNKSERTSRNDRPSKSNQDDAPRGRFAKRFDKPVRRDDQASPFERKPRRDDQTPRFEREEHKKPARFAKDDHKKPARFAKKRADKSVAESTVGKSERPFKKKWAPKKDRKAS